MMKILVVVVVVVVAYGFPLWYPGVLGYISLGDVLRLQ